MFNTEIESIFTDFTVDGVKIPVAFRFYDGDEDTYIVYLQETKDNSFSAEDKVQGWVEYYDFDIYSKGNYLAIIEAVKELLEANGWTYQPSRDSADMYERDTKFFHKVLSFAKESEVTNNG